MSEAERCENCMFFVKRKHKDFPDTCHAHAPTNGPGVTGWPMTEFNEWCGEWKAKVPELCKKPVNSPDGVFVGPCRRDRNHPGPCEYTGQWAND